MQAWSGTKYSFVIVIIVTHGNRKPWCRPLLIMELCHFFLCVFLIEWVLAVHARYSGGVRLGNLMLDSHLLGPHTSSTPDYCITDPSRKSSWYWHNTCSLSGNFPRDHILLLGLMSAEVSHSWRCVDNVAMAMWEKQLFIKVTWVFAFSGGLIKFLSYAFSFGLLPSERVVAECNL